MLLEAYLRNNHNKIISSLSQGNFVGLYYNAFTQIHSYWPSYKAEVCRSFLCYGFHGVRLGLVLDWTVLLRKWLRVIINDDFHEKGECYSLRLSALQITHTSVVRKLHFLSATLHSFVTAFML